MNFFQIQFRGNGHVKLSERFVGNIEPSHKLTIRMSFSPASAYNSDSLLLWQGSKSRNNFVAIGIKDQNLEFSMFSDFSIKVPLRIEKNISRLLKINLILKQCLRNFQSHIFTYIHVLLNFRL